jgi:hypothetical protein
MSADVSPAFDEWCIVELLGHRRHVGRVREAAFPAGFLRVDEPAGRTLFVNPAAVYALQVITEEVASRLADRWRTDPVARWELELDVPVAEAAAPTDKANGGLCPDPWAPQAKPVEAKSAAPKPGNWPPARGTVWTDRDGDHWACTGTGGRLRLVGEDCSLRTAEGVWTDYGPLRHLTLVDHDEEPPF